MSSAASSDEHPSQFTFNKDSNKHKSPYCQVQPPPSVPSKPLVCSAEMILLFERQKTQLLRDFQLASHCISKLQGILIMGEITLSLVIIVLIGTDADRELLCHFHFARLLANSYSLASAVLTRALPRLSLSTLVLSSIFAFNYLLLFIYVHKLTSTEHKTWLYLTGLYPFSDLVKAVLSVVLLRRIIERKK